MQYQRKYYKGAIVEELDTVGSAKAKAEFEARNLVAKDDEERIFGKEMKKHNINYDSDTNWAIYNWSMSTVSFKSVKTLPEGMRAMYSGLWGYFRRYEIELNTLKNHIEALGKGEVPSDVEVRRVKEILKSPTPLSMCITSLQKITEAARSRAKLKSYGVEVKKRGLVGKENAKL